MRLVEHLVDHHAVVADRSIDISPRSDHIGKASAEAVTGTANLGDALRADPLDGRFDIVDAVIRVILLRFGKSAYK